MQTIVSNTAVLPATQGLEVAESDWPVHFMRWVTRLEPSGGETRITQDLEYRVKLGPTLVMMSRGTLVAKLPKHRVDELVKSGVGEHFDPRRDGRLMKEWVEIGGTTPLWIELATEAHRFVKGIPEAGTESSKL